MSRIRRSDDDRAGPGHRPGPRARPLDPRDGRGGRGPRLGAPGQRCRRRPRAAPGRRSPRRRRPDRSRSAAATTSRPDPGLPARASCRRRAPCSSRTTPASCVPCRRALRRPARASRGRRRRGRPPSAARRPPRRARPWLRASPPSLAATWRWASALGSSSSSEMLRRRRRDGPRRVGRGRPLPRRRRRASRRSPPASRSTKARRSAPPRARRALVRMADGSLIEMSERAGLSLDAGRKGNTIHLGARPASSSRPPSSGTRHLYVATARRPGLGHRHDLLGQPRHQGLARVGGRGRGARRAGAAATSVLHPGDQVTTHASVERPCRSAEEIAWSRERRRSTASCCRADRRSAGRSTPRWSGPACATSTRLLDLAPGGHAWSGSALPNLAASLAETQRILDQRIAESPALRQWWERDACGSPANEREASTS